MRTHSRNRKSAWQLAFGFPIGSRRRPSRGFQPQVESLEDRWLLSTITDLGTIPGGSSSHAWGINDAGQVVGDSDTASNDTHAFLWQAGAGMTDLGTLGGRQSGALGINDAGQVVEAADTTFANATYHAFLWQARMTDLGTLPGDIYSGALGINDAGQVVGYSDTASYDEHAFLWKADVGMTALGALPGGIQSTASAINDAGQVVGSSDTASGAQHPFLWTPVMPNGTTGRMIDLNDLLPAGSGWTLLTADAINNSGEIVGYGFHNGQAHAFLLDVAPTVSPTSATWNFTSGGLDFYYNVSGSALTQDAPVDLYWADGTQWSDNLPPVSPDNSPLYVIPAGMQPGNYGPIHIDASVFLHAPDAPADTTNILVVADPQNSLGNFDPTTNVQALDDVQVSAQVRRPDFPLSDHTIEEVKKLLRASGQGSSQPAVVTSSIRTPYEQARAMYTNLELGNNVRYRRPGQAVIAVYDQDKQEGLPKDQILADMEQEIINQGPFNVSHHCSTPELWSMLQVLDIAPTSITNPDLFSAIAGQAVADGDLSRFLDRAQGDPAFHLEIPQGPSPSAGTGGKGGSSETALPLDSRSSLAPARSLVSGTILRNPFSGSASPMQRNAVAIRSDPAVDRGGDLTGPSAVLSPTRGEPFHSEAAILDGVFARRQGDEPAESRLPGLPDLFGDQDWRWV